MNDTHADSLFSAKVPVRSSIFGGAGLRLLNLAAIAAAAFFLCSNAASKPGSAAAGSIGVDDGPAAELELGTYGGIEGGAEGGNGGKAGATLEAGKGGNAIGPGAGGNGGMGGAWPANEGPGGKGGMTPAVVGAKGGSTAGGAGGNGGIALVTAGGGGGGV